jgi:hypothetical protein
LTIPLPGGGYLEGDSGSRDSLFHRKIVSSTRIPNTRTGQDHLLECGHHVQSYGDLSAADGWLLCTECRDNRN